MKKILLQANSPPIMPYKIDFSAEIKNLYIFFAWNQIQKSSAASVENLV